MDIILRENVRYKLRKIVYRQSLKRTENVKENVDRGMHNTSQRVFLFNHCVHSLPFLLTHACYMSLALHSSWVKSPYRFHWYVQTKFSAYLLGCILMHFGTELIPEVIDELYPTPDPHTAPNCEEIPSSFYASDLYSRGAWFESRM